MYCNQLDNSQVLIDFVLTRESSDLSCNFEVYVTLSRKERLSIFMVIGSEVYIHDTFLEIA